VLCAHHRVLSKPLPLHLLHSMRPADGRATLSASRRSAALATLAPVPLHTRQSSVFRGVRPMARVAAGRERQRRDALLAVVAARLAFRRQWAPLRQPFRCLCTQSTARHLHSRAPHSARRRQASGRAQHLWSCTLGTAARPPVGPQRQPAQNVVSSTLTRLHAVVYSRGSGSQDGRADHSTLHVDPQRRSIGRRRATLAARPA
jgi:hypothetical protein